MSSEAPAPLEPLEQQPPSQILAHGHLHPGILFLRFVDALRQILVPMIFAYLVGEGGIQVFILVAALGMFCLNMLYSLVRFMTYRYVLTTDELVTTWGILHRQERRIPVNRIQDLSFEQTLVRRMVGLVVVTVETAAGEGAEARMDSLGRADAARLRQALQWVRQAEPLATEPGTEPGAEPTQAFAEPEEVVHFRASAKDLMLRGLTDNRLGAIVVATALVLETADQFGMGNDLGGQAEQWLGQFNNFVHGLLPWDEGLIWALLALVGVMVVLVAGWIASISASFLMFHDFKLVQRGAIFQRRYGLLTTRVRSLPQRKIQRVLLQQNWLRRLLKLVVVRADSAGSGANQREEVKGGLDIVAPLCKLFTGRSLVRVLFPGMQAEGITWQRVSQRIVMRMFAQGLLLTALGLSLGLVYLGNYAWGFVLMAPGTLLMGILAYQNLGFCQVPGHLAMRWGYLGRYRAVIPLRKVQAVALRAGPLDRLFGLASVSVYVAGCGPTTLQHLTRSDALQLQQNLAAQAAQARFVW